MGGAQPEAVTFICVHEPTLPIFGGLFGKTAYTHTEGIFFGATVEVCNDAGESKTYRIVGPDEANAKTSSISIDSPLARALLKKKVDDEVVLETTEKVQ